MLLLPSIIFRHADDSLPMPLPFTLISRHFSSPLPLSCRFHCFSLFRHALLYFSPFFDCLIIALIFRCCCHFSFIDSSPRRHAFATTPLFAATLASYAVIAMTFRLFSPPFSFDILRR